MEYPDIRLGSDPELFLLDLEIGEPIPAGTVMDEYFRKRDIQLGQEFILSDTLYKRTTKPTRAGDTICLKPSVECSELGPGLNVDGMALELNPVVDHCRIHSVMSLNQGLVVTNEIIKELSNWKNLQICINPLVRLNEQTLKSLPSQARVFGCDPDLDVYGDMVCSPKIDASKHPFRYGGGHIHMSRLDKKDSIKFYQENIFRITQCLDRLVGIGMTALAVSELESQRRAIYGQAGKIRIQPYGGIEYRTPSNAWLRHPSLVSFVHLLTKMANNIPLDEDAWEALSDLVDLEDIIRIINEGKHDEAFDILNITLNEMARFENVSNVRYGEYPKEPRAHRGEEFLLYPKHIYQKGGIFEAFPDLTGWDSKFLDYTKASTVKSMSHYLTEEGVL